ncbi:MAG: type IV toxin-antitoxin system AbiEi family antitoxin domain-containing protein [Acidimicrobiaceae bacterium]|nr:type IV toxin-antitoxin system AbiEi family antitoxin domain-containing protein [Acidimicrobiaceae bacterium]
MRYSERSLAQWLRSHDNTITHRRARALGLSGRQIAYLVRRGRWTRVSRGVYRAAVTRESPRSQLAAAITACGDDAVASHLSAAWLLKLVDRPPVRPHITVGASRHPAPPGVVVHRRAGPVPKHSVGGLPLTSPARTLIDLAAVVDRTTLEGAVDRALWQRLVTVGQLVAETSPAGGTRRPGVAVLRAHLSDRGDLGVPGPSVLESRMQRLFRHHGLPLPAAEVCWEDGRYRLDFAYPDRLVAAEVDGYAWHHSPEQVERDTVRRNRLQAAGWTVLVYTWRQVVRDPERVAAEIRGALRRSA